MDNDFTEFFPRLKSIFLINIESTILSTALSPASKLKLQLLKSDAIKGRDCSFNNIFNSSRNP